MKLTKESSARKITIWVLCGGPSSEYEVSLSSGKVVCMQMDCAGRRVRPVIISKQGLWHISDNVILENEDRGWLESFFEMASSDWATGGVDLATALAHMYDDDIDCAFLVFHGTYGEDGAVQGFFQTAEIPYTGSGVLASAAAMNKATALATFSRAGLKTARSVLVSREDPSPSNLSDLKLPVFTKPVRGGSSVGVSLIKSQEQLEEGIQLALEYDTQALVEEKIDGVEVSCGVIDVIREDKIESVPLPPTLISPTEAEFFDYAAKYVPGKSRDVTPAPLPEDVIQAIQETALVAHRSLECEGMSRTDMIVGTEPGSLPVILEIQTIPGLTPTSLLPQQCAAVGITFSAFLNQLIDHALFRAGDLEYYE